MNKLLLYEYTSLLMSDEKKLPNSYFLNGEKRNHQTALELFHYAFEYFLKWTPQEVEHYLSEDVIKKMKLEQAYHFIKFPPEISKKNQLSYIAYLLYPDKIFFNLEKVVIETYKDVLSGTLSKFPKKYFDGSDGKKKACICLSYLLEHQNYFKSAEEGYKFFASREGKKQLNNNKLRPVWKNVFMSPVSFYHETLTEEMRDDFYMHYYEMLFQKSEEDFLNREKANKKDVL